MKTEDRIYQEALQVATMYYYQGLTTEVIAREMKFSRPKVSRLLSHARATGMVEIRIVNVQSMLSPLEARIRERFGLEAVHIVPTPELMGEVIWLERVARYTANYLNTILDNNLTVALAWGTTISEITANLVPKHLPELTVVQLNGSGNTFTPDNRYAANILQRFAQNYEASAVLFPVPTFFDYRETKDAMWRERSIRRIIDIQTDADVFLYSIGAVDAGVPSHVYSHGYLDPADIAELQREHVVGDLATVFFRADGSWEDIALNKRASGPPLSLYGAGKRSICVVSGRNKVPGLLAALQARLMTELIVDEPTARQLSREAGIAESSENHQL
ncbi:MAG: sugar-binding transcriptional regulator [Spirochaeta sp.]|jgi:deoxyribonucleoside regulator|nr:sugar-binding transcriptional regulator [Spirochaeta sp.]